MATSTELTYGTQEHYIDGAFRASGAELRVLVDAAFAETNPVPVKWVMKQLACWPLTMPASRSHR